MTSRLPRLKSSPPRIPDAATHSLASPAIDHSLAGRAGEFPLGRPAGVCSLAVLAAAGFLAGFASGCRLTGVAADPAAGPASTARYEAEGVKALDGDSLVVRFDNGLKDEVRLLGLDTPEHGQELADQARSFLHSRIAGRRIVLETEAEERDDHNRLLAHVLLDGRSLNLDLLEQGFAAVLIIPPNTARADALLEAQARAHDQRLGIWRPGLVLEDPRSWRSRKRDSGKEEAAQPLLYDEHLITGNRRSRVAHWPACRHVREIDPRNRVLLHSVADAERLGYRMEKRSR